MHRRNFDPRVVGVSDAMRGMGLSVEGPSFPLHNALGFGTRTICDLYGRPFVVTVQASDGTEYAPVDMEKVVIPTGLLLDVNITPDEMTEVAALLGGGDAIVTRNLVTWYRIVQFVTNKPIHLALSHGDVVITVQAKLHVHLWRNFTTGAGAVTVELRQNQVFKTASSDTDTPSDVIPCVAGLMAMPLVDVLAAVHFPGVQHKKNGTELRRAGKKADGGLLCDKPRRVLHTSFVAKCGACHTHLKQAGVHTVHTDPAASVHVALCGACAASPAGSTIGGARYALAGGPKRRLVRQGSVAEQSAPLTESGSAVGIAVLLALERNSRIAKGGTSTTIVDPLARCIAELTQFGAIVGPKLVFSSSAWWKLRVKINLRRIVQKCHTRLVERALLEAECDKLKLGEVKKKQVFSLPPLCANAQKRACFVF